MSDSAEQLHAPLNLAGDAIETGDDGAPYLVGIQCMDCAVRVFPPVEVCPDCMSENLARLRLTPRGTLYSWSLVHVAPKGWTVPYIAGYVDLPEQVRVFAHIVDADPERLAFDMDVTLCVRTLGEDENGAPVTSYAFQPAGQGED